MTLGHFINRRFFLGAGLVVAPALVTEAAAAKPASTTKGAPIGVVSPPNLVPSETVNQTARLQAAIDQAAIAGVPLVLAAGTYVADALQLRPGTRIIGVPGATVIRTGGISAEASNKLRLEHITIDGSTTTSNRNPATALLQFNDCLEFEFNGLTLTNASTHGARLNRCSGRIHASRISAIGDVGLFSLDGDVETGGLAISSSHVTDCGNNGILIWRTAKGHDGSRITETTISRIGNRSGGSGQHGNGVNVFRAAGVAISNCQISDCSYSAVRGNTADAIQMRNNHARRIGEVALYAEFGFEGAVISSNVIENAAAGIAITNFNDGGRLAIIEGNLIRNLRRREFEPADKRGEGISVEADAAITGNVIEGAETAGLVIGWGPHLRDVVATGNLIRASRVGIAVSGNAKAGSCLIANNMISGAPGGAIRSMDHATPLGRDLLTGTPPKHITLVGNVAR
jgi:uncharacterized secreted repeat protein (TIGR03808 family)